MERPAEQLEGEYRPEVMGRRLGSSPAPGLSPSKQLARPPESVKESTSARPETLGAVARIFISRVATPTVVFKVQASVAVTWTCVAVRDAVVLYCHFQTTRAGAIAANVRPKLPAGYASPHWLPCAPQRVGIWLRIGSIVCYTTRVSPLRIVCRSMLGSSAVHMFMRPARCNRRISMTSFSQLWASCMVWGLSM